MSGFWIVEVTEGADNQGYEPTKYLVGPFSEAEVAQAWMDDQPDDTDVYDMEALWVNTLESVNEGEVVCT